MSADILPPAIATKDGYLFALESYHLIGQTPAPLRPSANFLGIVSHFGYIIFYYRWDGWNAEGCSLRTTAHDYRLELVRRANPYAVYERLF